MTSHAEECPSSLPTDYSSSQLKACIEEISTLKSQIATITERLDALPSTPPAPVTPSIPAGVVAAFDLQAGCPAGWAPYTRANGRTIVGAINSGTGEAPNFKHEVRDKRLYHYNERHGQERVTLSVNEMPAHNHDIRRKGSDTAIINPGFGSSLGVTGTIGPTETGEKGGGASHNNMPPYVALYYCRKVAE